MRPLPAPRALARLAAVQGANEGATSAIFTQRAGLGNARADTGWLARYLDWQPWARRYARELNPAAFGADVISDLCARCEVFVAERDPSGEWVRSENPAFVNLIENEYQNALQSAGDLIRVHAWHYQTDGEGLFAWYDSPDLPGVVQYAIWSVAAATWNQPRDGLVTLKLVPDGKPENKTAVVVPVEQVKRFWRQDPQFPAYAISPMTAGVEDLHRYRALVRRVKHQAESNLSMDGIMYFPRGDDDVLTPPVDDPADEPGPDRPIDELEESYYQMAQLRLNESDQVEAVAPPFVRGAKDARPEWVKVGDVLDPNGIAYRTEALEDYFRGSPIPVTTGMGGGVGGGNHWSEWLATEKFVDSGVRPTQNRVCHIDLTRMFLWPRARLSGWTPVQLRRIRIDYDITPIVVKQDKSANAIELLKVAGISYEAARQACDFDEDDAPTPADVQQLIEVTRSRVTEQSVPTITPSPGTTQLPAGPATTNKAPPLRPVAPPENPAQAAAVSGNGQGTDTAGDRPATARERALLGRLAKLRSSLGTRLLAQARSAYEGALRAAGQKIMTRARRQSATRQRQVRAAVDGRLPLGPLLAAVGITELELLDRSFDTFRDVAVSEISRYQDRARTAIERAGLDPSRYMPNDLRAEDAAAVIVSGLTAMARRRLLEGDEAVLAAIPLARPPSGFGLPGLPDPEELAQAAARFVRQGLAVAEGRATMRLPATPDEIPEVVTLEDSQTLEELVAADLEVETLWTWVHGFYGEPPNPFDPHQQLGDDGFQTTDREHDPDLANLEPWPEYDTYFPMDHDGCTCEWVLTETGGRPGPTPDVLALGLGLRNIAPAPESTVDVGLEAEDLSLD